MKKLIRLKPLNPFFFGTNKTFSDERLHDVVSSYYPQQTHLLGMLRYFLLHSNNWIKLRKRGRWVKNSDFTKAFSIIGGYDKNNPEQSEESFGKIKSISPVFIVSTKDNIIDDFHFVAPKDTGLKVEPVPSNDILYVANKERGKHFYINNYNPKIGYVDAITTSKFWEKYFMGSITHRTYDEKIDKSYLDKLSLLSFDSVFEEAKQVGIKRDSTTRTVKADDEGSFYNKTSYVFKESRYEFAFIVDIDTDFNQEDGFVYLGAERSSFRLKVEDYDARLQQLYPSISSSLDDNKQVALSDIYIEDFDTIEYMVNDGYIAHAHMDRCNTKHGKATGKYNKSSQKHFIPKGSVIYFKDGFDVNSLDVKIGYNTVIKTKEN